MSPKAPESRPSSIAVGLVSARSILLIIAFETPDRSARSLGNGKMCTGTVHWMRTVPRSRTWGPGRVPVLRAARVQARAQPGEVWVSKTVTDLVTGSGIIFSNRGEHQLKGVPGTWQLLAVEHEATR